MFSEEKFWETTLKKTMITSGGELEARQKLVYLISLYVQTSSLSDERIDLTRHSFLLNLSVKCFSSSSAKWNRKLWCFVEKFYITFEFPSTYFTIKVNFRDKSTKIAAATNELFQFSPFHKLSKAALLSKYLIWWEHTHCVSKQSFNENI